MWAANLKKDVDRYLDQQETIDMKVKIVHYTLEADEEKTLDITISKYYSDRCIRDAVKEQLGRGQDFEIIEFETI